MVVRNVFTSWRVARSLVVFPHPDGTMDTGVMITGHPSLAVAAFESAFAGRPVRRGLEWFRQALAEVGPLPDDGRCQGGVRWSSVVIALVTVGVSIWGYRHVSA